MHNEVRLEIGDVSVVLDGQYDIRISDTDIHIRPVQNTALTQEESDNGKREKEVFDQDKITSGSISLYGLVELWMQNFDKSGTQQPDRMSALTECYSSNGDNVVMFLRYSKGLTNAIYSLFPALPAANDLQIVEHLKYLRRIAGNIAQVSSISAPEISDYYEPHANYLQQKFYW